MLLKRLIVSALALFGLFSLLSSLSTLAPSDVTVAKGHNINGCDPGIPPVPLSDMASVPVNFYSETMTTGSNEDYIVSFMPPKPMAVELSDLERKVQVPFKFKTLHELRFRYDSAANQMDLLIDPDTSTSGDETLVTNVPFTGAYQATGDPLPMELINVPHEAVNKKRVRFFVQFRGLTTSFLLSDQ